jgi:membrane-associated phospholipid phosphatase
MCIVLLIINFSIPSSAQQVDSIQLTNIVRKQNWKKVAGLPIILVSTGLITSIDNEVFDRFEIHDKRNHVAPFFKTSADDYIQYSPIVTVYALNALGVKGVHDIANQTALLIKSEMIMIAMVFPLKIITAVPRPDTGYPNSFPSGHTAQAFAAATFLHKEYGKEHPLISVLGYTTATGVGVLRVLNNRHWVSDVFAGAGIGILATNLAYLTHQNKWGQKHNKRGLVMAPSYGNHTFSLCTVFHVNKLNARL